MRVLGLMSGTSVDGVDAAAAQLDLAGPPTAATLRLRRLGEATFAWPDPLRERILTAGQASIGQLCRLDRDLGTALGQLAAAAIDRFGPVELIASHGQTLHHEVAGDGQVRGTWQAGWPAAIAEGTGRPVVADFRVRDVTAGGQGAPLVSAVDALLLAGPAARTPVAALNLGGIANLTVLRPGAAPVAFDSGPGNALLDAACAAAGQRFDPGGALTAAGRVDQALLAVLREDAYLAAPPPKSTGKQRYHAGYLASALAAAPVPALADQLATLAALTAEAVTADTAGYRVQQVWVAGGGVHNAGLMAALRDRLASTGATLATTDELGLPVDAKEAYAFAVLGWLTWHGSPGNLPSCIGAAGPRLLGAITPGNGPLRLPPPVPVPPVRMAVEA